MPVLRIVDDRERRTGAPDTCEICEVCSWEDDPLQFEVPTRRGGVNDRSLNEVRRAFQEWPRLAIRTTNFGARREPMSFRLRPGRTFDRRVDGAVAGDVADVRRPRRFGSVRRRISTRVRASANGRVPCWRVYGSEGWGFESPSAPAKPQVRALLRSLAIGLVAIRGT